MTSGELAEAYEERFGQPVTRERMQIYGSRYHLRKTPETRARAASRSELYCAERVEWAREHIPGHTAEEIVAGYSSAFGVTLTRKQVRRLKELSGARQGIHAGYAKGNVPHNKGRPWGEWMSEGGQEAVRSAGNLFDRGSVPHNASHRILDVREDRRCGPMIYVRPRNAKRVSEYWMSLGKFVWMQANGTDFPDGHHLVHADRDRTNNDPSNLVAVPDDVYAVVTTGCRGTGIRYHDRETLEAAIALARLTIRRKAVAQRAPRRCSRCGATFVPPDEQRGFAEHVRLCPDCNARRKESRSA